MLGIQAESPMVKTVLPLQGTWVQTLVGTKIPRATQHGKKKKNLAKYDVFLFFQEVICIFRISRRNLLSHTEYACVLHICVFFPLYRMTWWGTPNSYPTGTNA